VELSFYNVKLETVLGSIADCCKLEVLSTWVSEHKYKASFVLIWLNFWETRNLNAFHEVDTFEPTALVELAIAKTGSF